MVGCHEATRQAQPEPRTAIRCLGREERLEQAKPRLGRDPRAAISHRELEPIAIGVDVEPDPPLGRGRDRIVGVAEQVHEHL